MKVQISELVSWLNREGRVFLETQIDDLGKLCGIGPSGSKPYLGDFSVSSPTKSLAKLRLSRSIDQEADVELVGRCQGVGSVRPRCGNPLALLITWVIDDGEGNEYPQELLIPTWAADSAIELA